jgi:hypothetical protein
MVNVSIFTNKFYQEPSFEVMLIVAYSVCDILCHAALQTKLSVHSTAISSVPSATIEAAVCSYTSTDHIA